MKTFLFDMDGTLTLGDRAIPGAQSLVAYLVRTGRRVFVVTNNSSRSKHTYARKLKDLGFHLAISQIVSSTDAAIAYIRKKLPGKLIFPVGTPEFILELSAADLQIYTSVWPKLSNAPTPDVVLLSFDTSTTFAKLAEASWHIHRGARFLATNPDLRCPVPGGFLPDCGALASLIQAATGTAPLYLGKPHIAIVEAALDGLPACSANECAFVGDRLYTDMETAIQNGLVPIAVLSGEATLEDVLMSDRYRTCLVYESVKELQAAIELEDRRDLRWHSNV